MKHGAMQKALVLAKIKANEKTKRPSWDNPRKGPWRGAARKAEGGPIDQPYKGQNLGPLAGGDITWDAAPAQNTPPTSVAPDASGIAWDDAKPKADFSWGQAVTDIPKEIGNAASENYEAIKKGFSPYDDGKRGIVEGFMDTGKGLAAIPGLAMSPLTGTYRSLIGHGMANAVHAAGNVIAPDIAAKDDPTDLYGKGKEAADTAMSALAARRIPAPAVAPTIPKPTTIGDFDVPLTAGEAAGDFSTRADEIRALRGGSGPQAQRRAQQFVDERDTALENARSGIGKSFDRFGQTIVDDPHHAASLASQAVQDTAAARKAQYQDLYKKSEELPGQIRSSAFDDLPTQIKNKLSSGDSPVIIDDRTTPLASQALQDIERQTQAGQIQNRAGTASPEDLKSVTGIDLKDVYQMRKRLNTFANDAKKYPPDADTRATRAIVDAFDKHIQNAVDNGLFAGNDKALQHFKDANAAYSKYRRDFTPQGSGDDVGRIMQKILGRGEDGTAATPTEVANYLYGSANIGAKGSSMRLAQRLRNVLGADSPEWDGIRQGLWSRMTKSTEGRTDWGPQKQSERIAEFLNGSGKPLASSMFSPVEREAMQRYSDLLKKLVPPPGSVNYSNNLPMLNAIAEKAHEHIGTIVGAKIGGLPGAVAGYAAGKGTGMLSNMASARKIANQMPLIGETLDKWQKAQAAAARGKVPSTPATVTASINLARALKNLGFDYAATLQRLQGAMPARADQEQQKP